MMICCAAAWLLAACSKDDDLPGGQTGGNGNSIILDISSGALPVSRATVPAVAQIVPCMVDSMG